MPCVMVANIPVISPEPFYKVQTLPPYLRGGGDFQSGQIWGDRNVLVKVKFLTKTIYFTC